ncbi:MULTISPECIES: DNA-directed RNA polymerase subunit delta [unclassified Mycoplasma]|uniref:DNA-directed RNA polymerase subunit delta n=1 Tax=unclassified Mycoplasma TaxID=2683645 RepID=UPI00211D01C5|nr:MULTISPECIES: hypothetical protein [unclassified Mycoplasma]UUM19572.1 hypothetical protein NPA11_02230 [Mycoplasma sp. 1578d]UUM24491.1 hypothetical protein NPA12_02205 [Mycoplasma sp. 3686d]
MRTMLDIAIDEIKKDPLKKFEFNEIFEVVENELKQTWTLNFVSNEIPYEKVRERKIGELYTLLTVDRRFERNSDGTWQSKNAEFF